jgi:hypothetical protein
MRFISAPSLKRADCGIAVEGATDAARAAADVVFLDEGLSTIITSIKVSRQIFHRMKAYIEYRIALCLHLEIYLALSILILGETIRVDLIVFLAIFADVATIAIAYDNAPVAKQPVEWQQPKICESLVLERIQRLIRVQGSSLPSSVFSWLSAPGSCAAPSSLASGPVPILTTLEVLLRAPTVSSKTSATSKAFSSWKSR